MLDIIIGMKKIVISLIFTNLLIGFGIAKVLSSEPGPVQQLDFKSLELLSALAANPEKFMEFSKKSPQLDIHEASVQYIGPTITKFLVKGAKMEGDIILGDVLLTINRTRHGTSPEYYFYTYSTSVSD
jgi:hypothetical protein